MVKKEVPQNLMANPRKETPGIKGYRKYKVTRVFQPKAHQMNPWKKP